MDPSTNQLSSKVKNSSSAAPLVPPMPVNPIPRGDESVNAIDVRAYLDDLGAWGCQCAEIAQAQARRADEAEAKLGDATWKIESLMEFSRSNPEFQKWADKMKSERGALQTRVAELKAEIEAMKEGEYYLMALKAEATLAQRDREVLELRSVLAQIRDEDILREDMIDLAIATLASTAQAGAEAEQRIREDEREKWVALIRWLNGEADDFPARPEKVEGRPWPLYWWRTELMHRVAAILGTGGEARS